MTREFAPKQYDKKLDHESSSWNENDMKKNVMKYHALQFQVAYLMPPRNPRDIGF
jgi:hypothetical protein